MTLSSQEAATRFAAAKAALETAQSKYDARIEQRAVAVRKGVAALAAHDEAERTAIREIEVAAAAEGDRAAELTQATEREAVAAGIDAYNSAKRAADEVAGKIRELQRDVKPRVLATTQEAERVAHAIHLVNANLPAGYPPLDRLANHPDLIADKVLNGDGGWSRHEFWIEIAPEVWIPRYAPAALAPQSPAPAAEPDPHAWRAPVFHTLPRAAAPEEPAPAAAKVTPQESFVTLPRGKFVTLPRGM